MTKKSQANINPSIKLDKHSEACFIKHLNVEPIQVVLLMLLHSKGSLLALLSNTWK